MKILVTGGDGALGRRLAAEFRRRGHDVASPGRHLLDAASTRAVRAALGSFRPDVVVGCAAFTSVSRAERERAECWTGNLSTTLACLDACDAAGVPYVQVSSDYVVEGLPGPVAPTDLAALARPGNEYARSKAASEDAVLRSYPRSARAVVARVSILVPERVENARWLNGRTRASREWVEDSAVRLAAWVEAWRPGAEPYVVAHVVPPDRDVTVADLVRERWPDHPALADVVVDPDELRRRMGYVPPADVRLIAG